MVTLRVFHSLSGIVLLGIFLLIIGWIMYEIFPTATIIISIIVAAGLSYEGWLWYKRRQENRRWGTRE